MKKKFKKKFFLLGMGKSGISLAKFLSSNGIAYLCWDDNDKKRDYLLQENFNLSTVNLNNLKQCFFLVLSPGINHSSSNPHEAIKIAKKLNIKIITDLELLALLNYKNFLIGITGTNGKSTTTNFIQKITTNSKICGNFGVPFSDLEIQSNTKLVIEISSFQLSKIDKLKFDQAILLNISKDHLEWHGTMRDYIDSKLNIFKNQNENDNAIICVDDPYTNKIARNFNKRFKSRLVRISSKRKNVEIYLKQNRKSISIVNNLINHEITIPRDKIKFTQVEHNFQNLLACYVSAFLIKQSKDDFIKSIPKLTNLEHRIEFLGKFKNIHFYNDSKSTNVNSARTAIKSFKNIFWILGGREKEGGLQGIEKNLNNIVKAYCFGESGRKIKNFLDKNCIKCHKLSTLQESFEEAFKDAEKFKNEANILLSPACASFDQFENFEVRGQLFKRLVIEKLNVNEL